MFPFTTPQLLAILLVPAASVQAKPILSFVVDTTPSHSAKSSMNRASTAQPTLKALRNKVTSADKWVSLDFQGEMEAGKH